MHDVPENLLGTAIVDQFRNDPKKAPSALMRYLRRELAVHDAESADCVVRRDDGLWIHQSAAL